MICEIHYNPPNDGDRESADHLVTKRYSHKELKTSLCALSGRSQQNPHQIS
jgi:hypothetical protein